MRQIIPVTISVLGEEGLVSIIDYWNGKADTLTYKTNIVKNRFDEDFLCLVERLQESDILYNQELSFDLTKGFPKLFNQEYEKYEVESVCPKYFSDKSVLCVVEDINISNIPQLIYNESLVAVERNLEKISFFFLRINKDEAIDTWLSMESTGIQKLVIEDNGDCKLEL